VRVRQLDAAVIGLLKAQAKKKGLSLQADLKELLTNAAMEPRRKLVADLEAHQERMRQLCGVQPDSTADIRAERDRIG
jgi:plasmid stability protein